MTARWPPGGEKLAGDDGGERTGGGVKQPVRMKLPLARDQLHREHGAEKHPKVAHVPEQEKNVSASFRKVAHAEKNGRKQKKYACEHISHRGVKVALQFPEIDRFHAV